MNFVPKWISIVAILIALLSVVVAFSLYFSPATFIENIDFSDPEIQYLANMWAARQFAIAFAIIFAVLKQHSAMLRVGLLVYVVMNVLDALIGYSRGDSGLMIGASIFGLLAAIMIWVLNQKEAQS
ncbi:MAG: hypothetical protein KDD94_07915 [Calditrichaeota bacterium]|nr:hypothetical protein [Calditrichota bacterium]